jgi:hypothetical protein
MKLGSCLEYCTGKWSNVVALVNLIWLWSLDHGLTRGRMKNMRCILDLDDSSLLINDMFTKRNPYLDSQYRTQFAAVRIENEPRVALRVLQCKSAVYLCVYAMRVVALSKNLRRTRRCQWFHV